MNHYRRNLKSGKIHRLDADNRSKERCNVDQIADYDELFRDEALRLVAAHEAMRCGHCNWEGEDA